MNDNINKSVINIDRYWSFLNINDLLISMINF